MAKSKRAAGSLFSVDRLWRYKSGYWPRRKTSRQLTHKKTSLPGEIRKFFTIHVFIHVREKKYEKRGIRQFNFD